MAINLADGFVTPFCAPPKPLAVVLLSGGMDSLTAAGIAARDGYGLALIHFNYGQRTEEAELRSFNRIADFFGVGPKLKLVVHTNFFSLAGGSALTDKGLDVPEANLDSANVPVTYVPFRNAVLLSMAVGWAEIIGAGAVYYGAVSQDSSGYPDCRPEFISAFNVLVETGTKPETKIEVRAPLVNMTKAEIVQQAAALGLPLEATWSCYVRNDKACGACDSCALRLRGFSQAGMNDPIPYAPQAAGKPAMDKAERAEKVRRLALLLKALAKPST
ncbi:MAG: 7-cyano-7-deazaguanine synthase QueC [Acidobacteria bacterium]|jgi:7-cyano-7-deazaguanine synthase|nr:7-cyano-7-deazaguanine synthase QueC [Acidobacteriota bacterium]